MRQLKDYSKSKNETATKNQARKEISELFYDFLVKEYGTDNVGYVDNNTIGFICGTTVDKDGYTVDVVAQVKPIIKNYQDHCGEKRCTEAYDFDQAKSDYLEEKKSKANVKSLKKL